MRLRNFFAILLLLPQLLAGEIIETAQFADLLVHLDRTDPEKMLVVCDIDNTLLRSSQHLGCVAWGEYVIAQLESKGISKWQALEIESILWKAVQPYIKVLNVDFKAPDIIHEIQKSHIPIIALTARAPDETEYSHSQLQSLGIDLSNEDTSFPSQLIFVEGHHALYDRGILFGTLFNKKSKVLFSFLEKESLFPEYIIFVDDKLNHVQDLAEACKERGIHYLGIRFSGADEQIKNFDPLLAEIEWQAFPTLISDEQAQRIVNVIFTKIKKISDDCKEPILGPRAFTYFFKENSSKHPSVPLFSFGTGGFVSQDRCPVCRSNKL